MSIDPPDGWRGNWLGKAPERPFQYWRVLRSLLLGAFRRGHAGNQMNLGSLGTSRAWDSRAPWDCRVFPAARCLWRLLVVASEFQHNPSPPARCFSLSWHAGMSCCFNKLPKHKSQPCLHISVIISPCFSKHLLQSPKIRGNWQIHREMLWKVFIRDRFKGFGQFGSSSCW